MKKIFFILSSLIILFGGGCNQVDVTNPQLTYKEYIVVRAELQAYKFFDGVTFTKTLPISEAYDIKKAELKDVTVYLKINNVQVVPLHYTQNGIYLPLSDVMIQPGYTYELYGKENNTYIYSKTIVPQTPTVLSGSVAEDTYINAVVSPHANEGYGAKWVVFNPNSNTEIDNANDFQTIVNTSQDTISSLTIRTLDLPDKYRTSTYSNSLYVQVYAYDAQYQAYFNSRNNNQPVSNSFVQGGDQVVWNVYGNNVIGLFIGMNVSNYIKAR